MRSYETARQVFEVMEIGAWVVVALGVLLALVGGVSAANAGYGGPSLAAMMLAASPGIAITLLGLFGVAYVQTGRATVDTAEYSQQMLKVARDQLEVSRQGLRPGFTPTPGLAGLEQAEENSGGSAYEALAEEEEVASDLTQDVPELPDGTATADEASAKDVELDYAGQQVTVTNGAFYAAGKAFASLGKAKKHIDNMAAKASIKPDGPSENS